MRNIDWNNVPDAGAKPTPGGYAARICGVEDREDKEYLLIQWDFADGPYKGANADTFDRLGFWPTVIIKSYKETALPFFKGFKTAVENSNPNYVFRNDPQTLVGKFVGVVLGEEEYRKNSGEIGKRLYVAEVRSGKSIREGDFKVPDLKKLAGAAVPAAPAANYPAGGNDFTFVDDSNDDLPF